MSQSLAYQSLLEKFDVGSDDLSLLQECGQRLADKIDAVVDQFYEWLGRQPEFNMFFSSQDTVERVKRPILLKSSFAFCNGSSISTGSFQNGGQVGGHYLLHCTINVNYLFVHCIIPTEEARLGDKAGRQRTSKIRMKSLCLHHKRVRYG